VMSNYTERLKSMEVFWEYEISFRWRGASEVSDGGGVNRDFLREEGIYDEMLVK